MIQNDRKTLKVKMKSSFGWAAQAGVDIDLNEKMGTSKNSSYLSG